MKTQFAFPGEGIRLLGGAYAHEKQAQRARQQQAPGSFQVQRDGVAKGERRSNMLMPVCTASAILAPEAPGAALGS